MNFSMLLPRETRIQLSEKLVVRRGETTGCGVSCQRDCPFVGERFDASNPEIGKVGTFAIVPAGQAHFVWTLDEEAVVQLQFEGPSKTIFVDPADEPQQK
ncbi:hypothetical protein [Bradyrhizobium nanningense]|uniref:hypothetical protein n=1 Tax=Bradyrhizobium nanningense TaxID=1325118 RepID=UPI00100896CD|nr:hypothetical protein [Bradyrhizobium nanningense]